MPGTFLKLRTKGFTLVEMVIVVSLVAVLSGVVIQAVDYQNKRDIADDAVKQKNLEKLTQALGSYKELEGTVPKDTDGDGNPFDTPPGDEEEALSTYIDIWPEDVSYVSNGDDYAVYVPKSTNEHDYIKYSTNWDAEDKEGMSECGEPGIESIGTCTEPGLTFTGLELSESGNILMNTGETWDLQARAVYSDGSKHDVTGDCSWTSSKVSVAQVSDMGIVKAIEPGEANVEAEYTYGGKTFSDGVGVVVQESASSIYLNIQNPDPVEVEVGSFVNLVAYLYDEASGNPPKNVTYLSIWTDMTNNGTIVVHEGGQVFGETQGTATVKASYVHMDKTYTDTVTINVQAAPSAPYVTSVDLVPVTGVGGVINMAVDVSINFKVYAVYSDTSRVDVSTHVNWVVPSFLSKTVVDNAVMITALTAGKGAVSATYNVENDGTFTDSTTVTVSASGGCVSDSECVLTKCTIGKCPYCDIPTGTCVCKLCTLPPF